MPINWGRQFVHFCHFTQWHPNNFNKLPHIFIVALILFPLAFLSNTNLTSLTHCCISWSSLNLASNPSLFSLNSSSLELPLAIQRSLILLLSLLVISICNSANTHPLVLSLGCSKFWLVLTPFGLKLFPQKKIFHYRKHIRSHNTPEKDLILLFNTCAYQ